jgi:hypothetical protein
MTVSDLVSTPYGLVPLSATVALNRDETVKVVDGHLKKFDLRTDKVLDDLGPVSSDAVSSDPFTYAAKLRGDGEGKQQTKISDHWASDDSIKDVQTFAASWKVPSRPTNPHSSDVFFLWPGLSGGALQPVMEWDNGFGEVYGIRNWAFIAGNYVHGDLVKDLPPGTPLTGEISYQGTSSDGYTYSESFHGYPAADLTVTRSREQGDAEGVCLCYEPYSEVSPADQMSAFSSISLQLRPPNPTPSNITWGAGKCMAVVNSSSSHGEVDCYYRDCPSG